MPKTIFPSGLTFAALLKCNYLLVNLQEKKNNDFLTRGAVTANVRLVLHEGPGQIGRAGDQRKYKEMIHISPLS